MANEALGSVEPQMYPGPDLGQKFVSAWALGQNIALKKQELEKSLGMMAMRQQQLEYQNQFNREKFEQSMRNSEILNQARLTNMDTRRMAVENAWTKVQDANQRQQDVIQDTQGFTEHMFNANVQPNDPNFISEALAAKRLYPNAKFDLDDFLKQRNNASDNQLKEIKAGRDNLLQDFGVNHFANKQFADFNLLLNPNEKTVQAYATQPSDLEKEQGKTEGAPQPAGLPGVNYLKDPKTGSLLPKEGRIYATPNAVNPKLKDYTYLPNDELNAANRQAVDLHQRELKVPNKATVSTNYSKPAVPVYNQADRDRLESGDLYFTYDSAGGRHYFTK